MDLRHRTLRKVFDPSSATSFLSALHWSPIGTKIALLEQTSTSASAAADGINVRLRVVDLAAGEPTDLGAVLAKSAWIEWAFGERLAFVRGAGRATWDNKEVVVLGPDGVQHVVAGSAGAPVSDRAPGALAAIAPAWQPVYRGAKLAWIEGPAVGTDASPGGRSRTAERASGHRWSPPSVLRTAPSSARASASVPVGGQTNSAATRRMPS